MKTKPIQVTREWLARLRHRRAGITLAAGVAVIVTVALLVPPRSVQAYPSYQTDFTALYSGTTGTRLDNCVLCHVNGPSAGPRNAYGAAYATNGHSFTAIQNLDSDGDGFTNLEEINALTFPGDASDKPVAATATPTRTSPPPSATPTTVLPTATPPVAASPTSTSVGPSPMPTLTAPPGSPTPTATMVTSPGGLDLDIRAFRVSQEVEIKRDETNSIQIRLDIRTSSRADGQGTATVVGVQNGIEVYRASLAVSAGSSRRTRSYTFPAYLPTAGGTITWTATLSDGNPDDDTATASTLVKISDSSDDDKHDDEHDERDDRSNGQGSVSTGASGNSVSDNNAQTSGQPAATNPTTSDNNSQPAGQPVVSDTTVVSAPPEVAPTATVTAPDATGACTGTHVVLPGENLFRIGYDCGFSLQQMAIANGIAYPYRIYPGQTLRFP